ncbi:hypothetical protein [Kribbella koreensis]
MSSYRVTFSTRPSPNRSGGSRTAGAYRVLRNPPTDKPHPAKPSSR